MHQKKTTGGVPSGPKAATRFTTKANRDVLNRLPFDDTTCFDNAQKGFIASIDPVTMVHEDSGLNSYDISDLGFLSKEAPPTANPSLWRQAGLNVKNHGLFEVVEGIYQVRSFDLANMTVVKGETGWIIIDPLTSAESSAAALKLVNEQLGERPVKAVIITHSHADHFLGIQGVCTREEVAQGKVSITVPEHFVKEAISENVLAGTVMSRRAQYMYGWNLPHSPEGFISNGLGAGLSKGTIGLIPPTDIVKKTGETRVIDGVDIEFQMTPGSEAVSEFVFYFPRFKALCMSEITSHHLHNVYTPRGAQVRDALAWSGQINESIELFGDRLEIYFASHHWPLWGRDEVRIFLEKQRDMYKYIHDQTMRLANHGHTMDEIAEQLELPDCLGQLFYNRDYYGTVSHNAKAVYVKYLGWFDGNPANLNPLPPSAAGKHYVAFMGGADAVVEKARQCFERGEYRWTAQVLNHVVMSEPAHRPSRELLADAYEQMGYQAESGPWRNFYLTGALELRKERKRVEPQGMRKGMLGGIPLKQMFQAMAIRLNGPLAADKKLTLNLRFPDINEKWVIRIDNAVLNAFPHQHSDGADASMCLDSMEFKMMMTGAKSAMDLIGQGILTVEGDLNKLAELVGLLDKFDPNFPIVTPRES